MAIITRENYKQASLENWQKAFYELYGHIDDKRSVDNIWRHAIVNASRVSSDIRKHNFGFAFDHLAHLTNWLLTTVERCQNSEILDNNNLFYSEKKMSQIVWEKYSGVCPYCKTSSCTCSSPGKIEKIETFRSAYAPGVYTRPEEIPHTLDEWCSMFDTIYGNAHKVSPVEEIAFHLVEEMGEVAHEIIRITEIVNGQDAERKKEEFFLEIADVFSWICSLVNKINHTYFEPAARRFERRDDVVHKNITVETLSQILWHTYGSAHGLICPLCRNGPCSCDKKLRF